MNTKMKLLALVLLLSEPGLLTAGPVKSLRQTGQTTVEVGCENGERMTIDFYGPSIFRLFQDNKGGIMRAPSANPPAEILVDNPRKAVGTLALDTANLTVSTPAVCLRFHRESGLMTVEDRRTGKTAVEQVQPTAFKPSTTTFYLANRTAEYYYGGGVQNGRFSHRGQIIDIVNTNSWTDGGVASPTPFFWSTEGYALMAYTFTPGHYDFGKTEAGTVSVSHDTDYLDLFIMVDETPKALLCDYYQLTGNPVLLPKFAFYEGHLNAYNRDFWTETADSTGILFEDGKRYVESQKANGGIRESLNGEMDNYQFSARAVIDRYRAADMPLGWVLPNDGYGAGYGQTESLDGNIDNLKRFGEYARRHGVEVGLWTQSNLHPQEGVSALLQRDIVKEVRDAGVRVLKTDVAWVGAGYSFGLNGIADVATVMPKYGNNARPFIITLDGWAGSQRYGGVWTGDQTGGEWEYIRFHIPTYIGAGLSGMGNITSDMDGIFGGNNQQVNIRDFQWKAFTPMQLNMDGWGANPKYPQALGEPATSINRSYLKLKSMLLPYTYSVAHEATTGYPLMRAMLLDSPSDYTHGPATRYQYLYGPSLLVAPIYQATRPDAAGNDIRNGIYLPRGTWYDYFSGDTYEGGRILNNFDTPLWKLPVFVKAGAIIPLTAANNNVHEMDKTTRCYEIYPAGSTEFTQYDDDGTTEQYLKGAYSTTEICSELDAKGRLSVTIAPEMGTFDGQVKEKSTTLILNTGAKPKKVSARIGGRKVPLKEGDGIGRWAFVPEPELNRYATPGSEMARLSVKKNPQVVIRLPKSDVTRAKTEVEVRGFEPLRMYRELQKTGTLTPVSIDSTAATPYAITPTWTTQPGADYYEVDFQGQVYSTIRDNHLTFDDLQPGSRYAFRVRAVNKDGQSDWVSATAQTLTDPLKDALRGLTATSTAKDMDGFGIERLFDFQTGGDIWHTDYGLKAVPFEFVIDLHSTNTLDKMQYLPRENAGNGTLLRCEVFTSRDKKTWQSAGIQTWKRDKEAKEVIFTDHPTARYLKVAVHEAVGGFGSGAELYVFKQPGTKSLLPGDINQDGRIDDNDLTSYMNYTGLKKGDSDFDGYISNGDINGNGLIDAYDISNVSTLLEGGIRHPETETLAGSVQTAYDKTQYRAGAEVVLTVSGRGMQAINALNLVLPYSRQDLAFERVEPVATKEMKNMTYDRHHTDGSQVLYPTFTNIGEQPTLHGDATLFVIHFRAMRAFKPRKMAAKGLLVDRNLNELTF